MSLTEKYEILIAFLGREIPEKEYIAKIWNQAILEEYQKSTVYINVAIDERLLACVDCTESERGFIITSVRNPIQSQDPELYYNSLGSILFKVRNILGDPYTLITIEQVNSSFFPYDLKTSR